MGPELRFVCDYERYKTDLLATCNYYILNTTATFQVSELGIEELIRSLSPSDSLYATRAILCEGGYAGYCRVSLFNSREAYSKTAEVTLYLDPHYCGRGLGQRVLGYLENLAVEHGLHTLIGIISAENIKSIRMFERCAYQKCAHIRDSGFKFGRYIDTVYFQKIL